MLEKVPKYTLRKLSVGLASVMIGSGILMSSPKVHADSTNDTEPTPTSSVTQPTSEEKGGQTVILLLPLKHQVILPDLMVKKMMQTVNLSPVLKHQME